MEKELLNDKKSSKTKEEEDLERLSKEGYIGCGCLTIFLFLILSIGITVVFFVLGSSEEKMDEDIEIEDDFKKENTVSSSDRENKVINIRNEYRKYSPLLNSEISTFSISKIDSYSGEEIFLVQDNNIEIISNLKEVILNSELSLFLDYDINVQEIFNGDSSPVSLREAATYNEDYVLRMDNFIYYINVDYKSRMFFLTNASNSKDVLYLYYSEDTQPYAQYLGNLLLAANGIHKEFGYTTFQDLVY